jgi:hypothetical protein
MRPELYADSRDVWKWSVVIQHAQQIAVPVYWVAMLRPDANEHGRRENWDDLPPHTMPEVAAFFREERALINNGQMPNLWRVSRLAERIKISVQHNMCPYACSMAGRAKYVDGITSFLDGRSEDRRDLLLLDPDNGFGRSEGNGCQMHLDHLSRLWSVMRSNDALAMVQFNHHVPNWIETLRESLAGALDIDPRVLQPHPWQNICVYVATKNAE